MGYLMGYYSDLMGFYGDLMGFNGGFMGYYCDLPWGNQRWQLKIHAMFDSWVVENWNDPMPPTCQASPLGLPK
jgi:hypothetical protein